MCHWRRLARLTVGFRKRFGWYLVGNTGVEFYGKHASNGK